MGRYFGTDGFRGEAGIDLTADHAYKVGRFLGWYYNALRERNGNNEPARIVIGKDTRRSSYMFEYSAYFASDCFAVCRKFHEQSSVSEYCCGIPDWCGNRDDCSEFYERCKKIYGKSGR